MIETELEFGQGVMYQDESRPGKWRGDDSIQGEKLGERIKRSKSLEMQQDEREMGRKEDGEEVGFPGL